MHTPSPMAILVIAIVVLVLFGRGKVSALMGEVGKGVTAFRRGVSEETKEIEDAGEELPARTTIEIHHPSEEARENR